MKNPCYGCTRRTMTCHMTCKEGKAWSEWYAERKRVRDEAKAREYYSEFAKKATFRKIKEGRRK